MNRQMLVFIKPDGFVRKAAGARAMKELLSTGIRIRHFSKVSPPREFFAEKHYVEHKGKFFYEWMLDMVTSSPILAMIVEGGEDVTSVVRNALGSTIIEKADPSSIRGKYGMFDGINVVHASDSPESAEREVGLWKDILDSKEKEDYESLAREYIDTYSNFQMVDRKLYEEVKTAFQNGKIDIKTVGTELLDLLRKETDVDGETLKKFVDAVIGDLTLKRT